jgi:catechol 2,3-dioxygenase-like lactoylglutathione lyase family enzyme
VELSQTVPALPVAAIGPAVERWVDGLGFTCVHRDEGFAVLVRDRAEVHLWHADDVGWPLRPAAELLAGPVRTGAESFLAGTASCRIAVDDVDALFSELQAAGVLHPVSVGGPDDTAWGTREFAALDADGNLVTFFQRR